MHVIGRAGGDGPVGHLGRYRALDGSTGAAVGLDLEWPHVVLIVGKRGAGKSHTMGVLAEELATAGGVRPIVADPMGAFRSLAAAEAVPGRTVPATVPASALAPRAWCHLLGLDPASPAGTLCWRAAAECGTLAAMLEFVADADATRAARRAAGNHLRLAAGWDVFAPGSPDWLDGGGLARLDLAGRDRAAVNAVVAGVASRCYDRAVDGTPARLPWLLLDEAHVAFDGVAWRPLRRLLTRGRQPGVSLVAATQRPSALPETAIAQADVLVVHRLTSRADREAVAAAWPTPASGSLADRLPSEVGVALVVDDATGSAHTVAVRERRTPHDGDAPRASARAAGRGDTETVE